MHLTQLISSQKKDETFSPETLVIHPQYNYTVAQPQKPQFFKHAKHSHLI
jgi:hypothetical protein